MINRRAIFYRGWMKPDREEDYLAICFFYYGYAFSPIFEIEYGTLKPICLFHGSMDEENGDVHVEENCLLCGQSYCIGDECACEKRVLEYLGLILTQMFMVATTKRRSSPL